MRVSVCVCMYDKGWQVGGMEYGGLEPTDKHFFLTSKQKNIFQFIEFYLQVLLKILKNCQLNFGRWSFWGKWRSFQNEWRPEHARIGGRAFWWTRLKISILKENIFYFIFQTRMTNKQSICMTIDWHMSSLECICGWPLEMLASEFT